MEKEAAGGGACQKSWLGSEGTDRRKEVSLASLFSFFYLSFLFLFPISHCIWTYSGLFSFQHQHRIPHMPIFLLPVQTSYLLLSFNPFFHSFLQFSISLHHLLSTSASLCVFLLSPLAPSFHMERAWRVICASAS